MKKGTKALSNFTHLECGKVYAADFGDVTFTLNIGYRGAGHEETFSLEQLGIESSDFSTRKELNNLLEKEWKDWVNNFIDGGFTFN